MLSSKTILYSFLSSFCFERRFPWYGKLNEYFYRLDENGFQSRLIRNTELFYYEVTPFLNFDSDNVSLLVIIPFLAAGFTISLIVFFYELHKDKIHKITKS